MAYTANEHRYDHMSYRRCGNSGIKLPSLSLGLWHNFGGVDDYTHSQEIICAAFDQGITHFDLANNYGPPPGSAEITMGKVLSDQLKSYRNELVISSKAGYLMWPGPYGDWGSRKYLFNSLHDSLKRMKLDYVDIFYHHRPDPNTPFEESMMALHDMVKQGKALYVGISSYSAVESKIACDYLKELGTPCLIHQPKYNIFDRWVEDGLLQVAKQEGFGIIPFSPLAQGLLSDKYLNGIPKGSRAEKETGFLQTTDVTDKRVNQAIQLNELAKQRGQSLAQMSIAWLLNKPEVTSVLVGVSSIDQLMQNLKAQENITFTPDELKLIDDITLS